MDIYLYTSIIVSFVFFLYYQICFPIRSTNILQIGFLAMFLDFDCSGPSKKGFSKNHEIEQKVDMHIIISLIIINFNSK